MGKHTPIALIAAVSSNRAIGTDNHLVFQIREDMKYFKKMTEGKIVIMGRKTYESIGRPLPNRLNIVVTRDKSFTAEGVIVHHSWEGARHSAREHAKVKGTDEIMVIGGGEIYALALRDASVLYLTEIKEVVSDADAFFPIVNEYEWKEKSRTRNAKREGVPRFDFVTYCRVS